MHSPAVLITLIASAHLAAAATHTVLPGGSIQEKIDIAQPGDIIAVLGGTYPADLLINKNVRIVEADGHDVHLSGNVTFVDLSSPPPFENFAVGSSGKGVTIANCSNIILHNIVSIDGFGLKVAGTQAKAIVNRGEYSSIHQDGGELTVNGVSVIQNFEATQNCQKTVTHQSIIGQDVLWNAKKCWFGYSQAQKFDFDGIGCKVVVVGCVFDFKYRVHDALKLHGENNDYLVSNCQILNVRYGNNRHWNSFDGWRGVDYPGRGIHISAAGNKARIFNNYITMLWSPAEYIQENHAGSGIRSEGPALTAYNNLIVDPRHGVVAPYGADVQHNFYVNPKHGTDVNGVVAIGTVVGDPKFAETPPLLQPTSPCVNGGIPDPIFNNLDGSRNTIGPSGGCFFDPEGWTTDKPVVISFDLAPTILLKGTDTQITLSSGQAISQK
jgi:hypothetical protein